MLSTTCNTYTLVPEQFLASIIGLHVCVPYACDPSASMLDGLGTMHPSFVGSNQSTKMVVVLSEPISHVPSADYDFALQASRTLSTVQLIVLPPRSGEYDFLIKIMIPLKYWVCRPLPKSASTQSSSDCGGDLSKVASRDADAARTFRPS